MKNVLLIASLLFLIIFQLPAQHIALLEEPGNTVSQAAVNWENQKLRSDLTLSEEQFQKIKPVNLERLKARNMVKEMFRYEPKKQEAKLREIDRQFDAEFEAILNKKQFRKYLSLQGRSTSEPAPESVAETVAPEPDFNARIQDLISRATAPVVDDALLPKLDTTQLELSLETDSAAIDLEAITSTNADPKADKLPETGIEQKETKLNAAGNSSQETEATEGEFKIGAAQQKVKPGKEADIKTASSEGEDIPETAATNLKNKSSGIEINPGE